MKYYIVKTAYGYYDGMAGRTRIRFSVNINSCKHFIHKSSAVKRAKTINGEVLTCVWNCETQQLEII